jgi:hypothetical protein
VNDETGRGVHLTFHYSSTRTPDTLLRDSMQHSTLTIH